MATGISRGQLFQPRVQALDRYNAAAISFSPSFSPTYEHAEGRARWLGFAGSHSQLRRSCVTRTRRDVARQADRHHQTISHMTAMLRPKTEATETRTRKSYRSI